MLIDSRPPACTPFSSTTTPLPQQPSYYFGGRRILRPYHHHHHHGIKPGGCYNQTMGFKKCMPLVWLIKCLICSSIFTLSNSFAPRRSRTSLLQQQQEETHHHDVQQHCCSCGCYEKSLCNKYHQRTLLHSRSQPCNRLKIHDIGVYRLQSKLFDKQTDDEEMNEEIISNKIAPVSSSTRSSSTSANDDIVEEQFDPIYILPIITTTLIGIGLVYLLYVQSTNPSTGIDIDFYMALDGTLNNNNNNMSNGSIQDGGTSSMNNADFESILALPPLSPAEKIVGALFGPPSSNQY